MSTGITVNGFVGKTYEEIVDSLIRTAKLEWGEEFDTTEESPDGQELRILAKFFYDQWVLAEAAYNSYNPNAMKGVGLENICRLTRTKRIVDRATRVGVKFTSDGFISDGMVIPAGTIVQSRYDLTEFRTLSDVIIPGECVVECMVLGQIIIAPNEITVIKANQNIPDDVKVTNEYPGTTGVVREKDPELRARRERALVKEGTNTAEAIYAAVADLNLAFIAVLENDTNEEKDGIPPKSFLTVAEGSSLEEIALRIYRNKPGGIQAFGETIIQVTDSKGYPHPIGISRPARVGIKVKCLATRPANVAITGLRDIQWALRDHINGLQIAAPVVWSDLFAPATSAAKNIKIKSILTSTDGVTWAQDDIEVGAIGKAMTEDADVIIEETP